MAELLSRRPLTGRAGRPGHRQSPTGPQATARAHLPAHATHLSALTPPRPTPASGFQRAFVPHFLAGTSRLVVVYSGVGARLSEESHRGRGGGSPGPER